MTNQYVGKVFIRYARLFDENKLVLIVVTNQAVKVIALRPLQYDYCTSVHIVPKQ